MLSGYTFLEFKIKGRPLQWHSTAFFHNLLFSFYLRNGITGNFVKRCYSFYLNSSQCNVSVLCFSSKQGTEYGFSWNNQMPFILCCVIMLQQRYENNQFSAFIFQAAEILIFVINSLQFYFLEYSLVIFI